VSLLPEGRRQEELLWKLPVILCWKKSKKIFGSKNKTFPDILSTNKTVATK